MKKDRLLNAKIIEKIAALGHTETLCICDCGLPIPQSDVAIDISVTAGLPRFIDVLKAVNQELVTESILIASELEAINPALLAEMQAVLGCLPVEAIPHAEFKQRVQNAKCVIRTGETSPYANVLLVGGVNF